MFELLKYKGRLAVETDRGETLTYAQLNENVEQFSAHIPVRGLLFCLCENVLGSFVGYVACMTKGIPSVLLNGEMDSVLLKRLIDIYRPEFLWMPTRRAGEFGGETCYSYCDYSLRRMHYVELLPRGDIHPDLLLCLTTSGSTGSPKLVRLSLKNLISNAISIAQYLKIEQMERPITSLPMYYSFGMSVINSHLIKGSTILLTDKSILQKEFWEFFKEKRATSFAGVPYTYEVLRRLRFFRMELPSLHTMTQAGGKLNAAYVREFVDFAKKNGKEFIVMYGQTEASPRMSYLPKEVAIEKHASIGIAIPGGEFAIMDDRGEEIKVPDVDGELIYRGPNVCMGYAESREDLALGDVNHGVLHTGDVAHHDADGYYYITGRKKRFVKVWGNRCNLDAIEQMLKGIAVNCACVGVDDMITIFVTSDGLKDKIPAFLNEKTGLHPKAFAIKVIEEIPTSPSGKILYPELQKMI